MTDLYPAKTTELYELLSTIPGVTDAYLQPKPNVEMSYPAIVYERNDSYIRHADNLPYFWMKGWTVTVIDRDPKSGIPDVVEALPHCKFNRFFAREGLNHTVFNLFF